MARVVVDVPLAHLDRPFDYAVPEKLEDTVQAGCRVRVRFHGRLVDGVVWELGDSTDFAGSLQPLSHVPSGEPVLSVLEVNAGIAEKLGIKPGDKVEHPLFKR